MATALGLWGTDAQQQTYLPAFTGDDVPAAALALTEPTVLFDVLVAGDHRGARPTTASCSTASSPLVPRGADAELFVVGASLDGAPVLFLVESGTAGLEVEADPAMGVRAAGLTRLHLRDVTRPGRRGARGRPTARRTPSACGSPASPGARSRSASARPCSTT